jgi:hypothetical protein
MKKLLLTGMALVAIGPLVCSGALAQNAVSRTGACKVDCSTGNTHGLYRPYNLADPNLISPEGRMLYAECVRLCLAPLPASYFQKSIIDSGGSWFGKVKSDCLGCHAPGESPGRPAGVITPPEYLKRD